MMRHAFFSAMVLLTLSACGGSEQEPPVPAMPSASFDVVSASPVERGERLGFVLGCSGCHGPDLTGEDWSEDGFAQMWTANLTRAVASYDDTQLGEAITHGMRADGSDLWGMPSFLFTQLSEEEIASIIAWLRTLEPTGEVHPLPVLEQGALDEIEDGTFMSSSAEVAKMGEDWPPDAGPGHEQARYIARATCAECHKMDLRGGEAYPGGPLRPDIRLAGSYGPEDFRHFLRTGEAAGGRQLETMSGVARWRYSHLTDHEIDALHAYLKRLSEIDP